MYAWKRYQASEKSRISYTEFIDKVNAGEIIKARMEGDAIVPRGRALGVTVRIPEEDIHCYTKEMLVCHIKVLMGGRADSENCLCEYSIALSY